MNVKRGSVISLICYIFLMIICAIIIWPILDLIFAKFIYDTTFTYDIYNHIIQPIIFGFIAGIVYWVVDLIHIKNNKDKENKKN
jgi:hypothetical protein